MYSQEELERLTFAWLRRKKLEALLVANAVGELLGGGKTQKKTPDDFWAELERL